MGREVWVVEDRPRGTGAPWDPHPSVHGILRGISERDAERTREEYGDYIETRVVRYVPEDDS